MRRKFSERNGFVKVEDTFQLSDINDELSNRLWNAFNNYYIDVLSTNIHYNNLTNQKQIKFIKELYDQFFKTDEEPTLKRHQLKNDIKKRYSKLEWFQIYDFIEFISYKYPYSDRNEIFIKKINIVLEEENSGYRFVDEFIVPIIDKIEIDEIEKALNSQFYGVKLHLSNSLELLSDRENPDYTNSIKESISAIEGILNNISKSDKQNVPLQKAIKDLPFEINNIFKEGMIKLYSWTSYSDGIRHAVNGNEILSSFAEAKYMLVSCSAFVNYLIEKKRVYDKERN